MRDSNIRSNNFKRSAISMAVVAAMTAGGAMAASVVYTSTHTFSLNDVVGDYNGTTIGTAGNGSDGSIICGNVFIAGSPPCPADGPQPLVGDESWQLYPIDSTFGFNVVPFAEAYDKVRDGIYTEGWVGNIRVDGKQLGLEFSDAETDTFIVPAGMGTWCTGLGGASVKCSTEHFAVMEHVLTCHETIPYLYADPVAGTQAIITDPDGNPLVNCADKRLDNNLIGY